ncbi:MAG: hypothetical protein KF752_09305 [Pirellulaceae bacterium]|nr:hypothetical protein [Pirellulaceae bacterium]
MNVQRINELHALVEEAISNTDSSEQAIADQEEAIQATNKKLAKQKAKMAILENACLEAWNTFDSRVVEIGKALLADKQSFGKGWKTDFEKRGFTFSYVTAERYIRCAKHPEASKDTNTIEQWAKASADLDRTANPKKMVQEEVRKQRAMKRKEMSLVEDTSMSTSKAIKAKNRSTPAKSKLQSDIYAGFSVSHGNGTGHSLAGEKETEKLNQAKVCAAVEFLHEKMVNVKKYSELKPSWLILFESLNEDLRPQANVVSSLSSVDLEAPARGDMKKLLQPEAQNTPTKRRDRPRKVLA